MFGKMKRFVIRKKGMEALQAVLLLGAAFFIIAAIKQFTGNVVTGADQQLSNSYSPDKNSAQK